MYPQSGEALIGSTPGGNGVPAEAQLTSPPSPIDHTTRVGAAVTVTDTPGTRTVAVRGPQPDPSTHNQVGRFTNCGPAGFDLIRGAGNRNWREATIASCAGDTGAVPPRPPSGIQMA